MSISMVSWTIGNVDFGNGVDTTLSSTWHAALLKVSSSGQALWIKVFGENLLVGEALSRANGQEILVTGRIDGTADFGGITSTGPDDNFYLACFDTAGNGLWVNRYTSANLRGLTMEMDKLGQYLCGGQLAILQRPLWAFHRTVFKKQSGSAQI